MKHTFKIVLENIDGCVTVNGTESSEVLFRDMLRNVFGSRLFELHINNGGLSPYTFQTRNFHYESDFRFCEDFSETGHDNLKHFVYCLWEEALRIETIMKNNNYRETYTLQS